MNRSYTPIHAVAFDIDGTLYPNSSMYLASWPVVVKNLSLFRAFGKARKIVRIRRPVTNLFQETVDYVASELNRTSESVARDIKEIIYQQWESSLQRVRPYRGVLELLHFLRDRGIRTAALSDFPVERKLQFLGIDGFWDVAFSSEETGYLKPNPEPFIRLIDELGFPAENILYVGNSYHYDVVGARSCGLLTAHITHFRPTDSPADFTFRRFKELQRWLEARLTSEH